MRAHCTIYLGQSIDITYISSGFYRDGSPSTPSFRVRIIKKWNYFFCLSDWKKNGRRTWLMTFTIYSGHLFFCCSYYLCVKHKNGLYSTKYICIDNEIRKWVACVGECPLKIEYCINEQKIFTTNFYHFHCLFLLPCFIFVGSAGSSFNLSVCDFVFFINFSKFSFFLSENVAVYLCVCAW